MSLTSVSVPDGEQLDDWYRLWELIVCLSPLLILLGLADCFFRGNRRTGLRTFGIGVAGLLSAFLVLGVGVLVLSAGVELLSWVIGA